MRGRSNIEWIVYPFFHKITKVRRLNNFFWKTHQFVWETNIVTKFINITEYFQPCYHITRVLHLFKTDVCMFTARARLEKMFLIAGWRLKCFPLFHSLRPDLTCVYHQTTRSGTVNVHSWQWAINNLQKHAQCTYSMENGAWWGVTQMGEIRYVKM